MGKRKREDDDEDDYVEFCHGLQRSSRDGVGDTSYIYSSSRPFKRPRINPNIYKPTTVEYNYLCKTDSAYREIESLITNRSIVIDDIVEVRNPVLEKAYDLKRRQRQAEYGDTLKEELLFHGTKECNVESICRFNFDWRLTGSNKGHKFGKGTCFSRNAKYASSYSDNERHYKVMIVAKVLIARICKGYHDMSIPPQGFDTSQKGENGVVLVKYEDNEFYPAYILYYHFDTRGWNGYERSRCSCNRNWCSRNHSGDYYNWNYYYNEQPYDYDYSGYNKYACDSPGYSYNQRGSRQYYRNNHFYNSHGCSSNYSYDGQYEDSCSYFNFC